MGNMVDWHCEDCGAGEVFFTGGGFRSINIAEDIESAKSGAFGPAMKRLFKHGLPKGWYTFTESVYYRCPECGGFMHGRRIRIEDQSGGWLFYHEKPEPCSSCGAECEPFGDDNTGVSEDELVAVCEGYGKSGCPKCGSKHVSVSCGDFE